MSPDTAATTDNATTEAAATDEAVAAVRDELRVVELSAVEVREGFNPRQQFEARELDRLADSIRRHGILQPLLVTPAATPGTYELIAGERRYRAAFAAGLTEIPVLIRHREVGEAEGGEGLVAAIVENLHRADPTPLEEARAYRRLLDAGLTRHGVSQQLAVTAARVRERLALLDLPDEIHPLIDAGEVPLIAVPALLELTRIHPGLPACAVARVREQPQASWVRPLSWAEVAADPIGAVTSRYHDGARNLPDGVFEDGATYPLATFELSEKARRDLARLTELDDAWAGEGPGLMITREMVEHAQRLGAAHRSTRSHSTLIVGADVAGELVATVIARRLKDERAHARREHERHQTTQDHGGSGEAALSAGERADAEEERRRVERERERQARRDAEAYNDRLGTAVYKALSTVKIDADVVRVLTAVDLHGELEGIAMRGARYGFPDWVTTETTKNAKTKRTYLERPQALAKARDYLSGAQTPAQIAGRCLALVAMAVLADEDCVARSNRSGYSLHTYQRSPYATPGYGHSSGLAWTAQVTDLVEEICLKQLPAAVTDPLRTRREQHRAESAEREREAAAANAAYTELAARLPDLDVEAREQAIAAYEQEHPAGDFELEQLHTLHEQLRAGTPSADEEEPSGLREPASSEPEADAVS